MCDTVSGDMLAIAADLRGRGMYELATKVEIAAIKTRRIEMAMDEIVADAMEDAQLMHEARTAGYIADIRAGRA